MISPRAIAGGLLGCVLVLGATGCGERTCTVHGKVTLDGAPITFGTVVFISENGQARSTMIQPDSTYTAQKVRVGEAVVTVQTYPLPPMVQPPDKPQSGAPRTGEVRYTPIPASYADAQKSPLRCTVQAGEQLHDLALSKTGK